MKTSTVTLETTAATKDGQVTLIVRMPPLIHTANRATEAAGGAVVGGAGGGVEAAVFDECISGA